MKIKGKVLVKGIAEGLLLPSKQPLSFLGGVDPATGMVRDRAHELYGTMLKGKILALPYTVGSSVGAYIIYGIAKNGVGPSGIITELGDINLVSGCAVAGTPLISGISIDTILKYKGVKAKIDAETESLILSD
ncbi:MAG: DUF126 domain-containing protein [Conexivisphaerales archaeon]